MDGFDGDRINEDGTHAGWLDFWAGHADAFSRLSAFGVGDALHIGGGAFAVMVLRRVS